MNNRTKETVKRLLSLKYKKLDENQAIVTADYILHCFNETSETTDYWSFVEGFIYGSGN